MGVKENAEFLRWFNGVVRRNIDPSLTSLQRDLVRSGLIKKRLEVTPDKALGLDVALKEVLRIEELIDSELERYSMPKGEPS